MIARRTADRRREFGVRIALGARPAEVGRLVLNEAIALLAAGLMAGLPAAWAAAQVSASLLFGVSSSSPLVFAAALALLAVVSLAASLIPARSASRADPVRALRS